MKVTMINEGDFSNLPKSIRARLLDKMAYFNTSVWLQQSPADEMVKIYAIVNITGDVVLEIDPNKEWGYVPKITANKGSFETSCIYTVRGIEWYAINSSQIIALDIFGIKNYFEAIKEVTENVSMTFMGCSGISEYQLISVDDWREIESEYSCLDKMKGEQFWLRYGSKSVPGTIPVSINGRLRARKQTSAGKLHPVIRCSCNYTKGRLYEDSSNMVWLALEPNRLLAITSFAEDKPENLPVVMSEYFINGAIRVAQKGNRIEK